MESQQRYSSWCQQRYQTAHPDAKKHLSHHSNPHEQASSPAPRHRSPRGRNRISSTAVVAGMCKLRVSSSGHLDATNCTNKTKRSMQRTPFPLVCTPLLRLQLYRQGPTGTVTAPGAVDKEPAQSGDGPRRWGDFFMWRCHFFFFLDFKNAIQK